MARKKSATTEDKLWTKAKWKGFVNILLNSQEKREIKKNLLSTEDTFKFLEEVAAAGYKVSLSYSIPEDVYTVSLTGQYERKPNGGLTASIRHRDLNVALTAVWFAVREDGYAVDWQERFGEVDHDNW